MEGFFRDIETSRERSQNAERDHTLRPISKEECLRFLHGKELTSGSLLGMHKWAIDTEDASLHDEAGDAYNEPA